MRLSLSSTLALCLVAASTRADDLVYLPDNMQVYLSMDVVAVLEHRAIDDLKKRLPTVYDKIETQMQDFVGVAVKDIARITVGTVLSTEVNGIYRPASAVRVFTLHKPTSWAEVKARLKIHPVKTEFSFEEKKVGKFTLYQEKYKYNFNGNVDENFTVGQFYCLPKDNVLLLGSDALKVMERGEPAQLSPSMQPAYKGAAPNQTATLIFDIQGMPERERKSMIRDTPLPGFGEAIDKVNAGLLQGMLGDKLQLSTTAFCKDDVGAAAVKKVADEGMAAAKFMLADNEKLPKEARDLMKETRTLLGTVKTTAIGAQAKAEVAVDPAILIRMLEMTLAIEQRGDVAPPAQPVPAPPK